MALPGRIRFQNLPIRFWPASVEAYPQILPLGKDEAGCGSADAKKSRSRSCLRMQLFVGDSANLLTGSQIIFIFNDVRCTEAVIYDDFPFESSYSPERDNDF